MPIVVEEGPQGATIVDAEPSRFSWSAAFAGAIVAAGVTFLLLTLGSGVGLSLVSAHHATQQGTTTFLTLGAIYFLAAQAFGFAAGGHIVGRLIGPAIETSREEDFRAGAHGLVSWAIAAVATTMIVALSVLVVGTASATSAVNGALAASASGPRSDTAQSLATSYWTDKLFRPATTQSASAGWRRYAQNDTGTTTDVPPASEPSATPSENPPSDATSSRGDGSTVFLGGGQTAAPVTPVTSAPLATMRPIGADKAEAGRILTVGMANGEQLSGEDRARLATLVSSDTGLALAAAERRVDDVARRIHDDEVAAAETARKVAATVSLWTAFALLFGAVVAVIAAVSARWEDDREAGLLPGTRVVETRF